MVKAPLFTIKGTKTGEFTLPKEVFELKPNLNLVAQAIHVYQERDHIGLRKAKTRSEVNRTTKKLYKQKGTGGARHGSRRAPIFVGGGVAFGPRPIRRILTLSQVMKSKARNHAFSVKASEKQIAVVSGISKIIKTKEAADFLNKIKSTLGLKRFTFILADESHEAAKSIRNLKSAVSVPYSQVNAFHIWTGGGLILDKAIFEVKKSIKK